MAGDYLRTNAENPAPSVIKNICVPRNAPLKVPPIAWGNYHEEDAFRLYTNLYTNAGPKPECAPSGQVYLTMPTCHTESGVKKSGLVIDKGCVFLGASPDGKVHCQCCRVGILEIKCPYACRSKTLKDSLLERSFCIDEQFQLKKKHSYYVQVQLQMYVRQVGFADFVVWTPIDCIITRENRDGDCIDQMISALTVFWKSNILPELVTRRLKLQCHENKMKKVLPQPDCNTPVFVSARLLQSLKIWWAVITVTSGTIPNA